MSEKQVIQRIKKQLDIPDSPVGKFVSSSGQFIQTEDRWECQMLSGHTLIVMKGATSDGYSIPWLMQTPFSPRLDSRSFPAAYVHDQLYVSEIVPRITADMEFHRLMLAFKYTKFKAWMYYRAVRLFGWNVWRKHTRESVAKGRLYVNLCCSPCSPRKKLQHGDVNNAGDKPAKYARTYTH